jgi:signal transduction histidine kinase
MSEEDKKLNYLRIATGLVRHDISNQMSIVSGFSDLLKIGSEHYEDYIKKIISASERVKRQLKLLEECEAGISLSWVSFKTAYSSCEKPLEIEVSVGETMDKVNIYSSSLISKVLENLLDNSVRHGKIPEARLLARINCQTKGENLIITYEDNGRGILPESKQRIFEKGYGKNTGMGMFLTREILLLTGIEISEVGEFGKGAKFEIVIPKNAYKLE